MRPRASLCNPRLQIAYVVLDNRFEVGTIHD